MKKTLLILLIPAFFQSMVATAQIGAKVKKSTNDIEGVWENNEFGFSMVLMLNAGGSGEFDGEDISYKISGDRLDIVTSGVSTSYIYNLSGNQLTLSGGDLDKPIIFTRNNNNGSGIEGSITNSAEQSSDGGLPGKWYSSTENLEFRTDGMVVIQGMNLPYSVSGNIITIQSPNGPQNFTYAISGESLTINSNGQRQMYSRTGNQNSQSSNAGSQDNQIQGGFTGDHGTIAPELEGKWCYVNTTSTGSGGWSTDECIIINGDGTYEYSFESSGSATGYNQYGDQTFTGGTANQSSDRGTWRLAGNILYVQSQAKGSMTLSLQKVNHPKNGDPMIVINGRSYVTYYQKPSW